VPQPRQERLPRRLEESQEVRAHLQNDTQGCDLVSLGLRRFWRALAQHKMPTKKSQHRTTPIRVASAIGVGSTWPSKLRLTII